MTIDDWHGPVSYVVVACRGTGRYFDLDGVRGDHSEPGRTWAQGDKRSELQPHRNGKVIDQNPAGVPPLDWHLDADDERDAVTEPLSLFPIDPDLHVSETPTGPRRTELGRWGQATVHIGDVRDVLAKLPDGSVDFLCTSPPFLALRSYLPADHPDKHREIGSEPDPATFIDTLLALTADWGRVLAPWGSIAVELGDTFSGGGGAGGDYNPGGLREGQEAFTGSAKRRVGGRGDGRLGHRDGYKSDEPMLVQPNGGPGWPLGKSLCGIPQAYQLSLTYGQNVLNGNPSPAGQWRVRNVIVWARPNPPVGSLGKRNPEQRTGDQRFRVATSYITVACRGTGRYFDLDGVREAYLHPNHPQLGNPTSYRSGMSGEGYGDDGRGTGRIRTENPAGAPPLDWHADDHPEDGDWLWKLPTAPYKGAHYATYPLALPKRLIEAMCPRAVCTVCGWPRERVVDVGYEPTDNRRANFSGTSRAGQFGRGGGPVAEAQNRLRATPSTLGWTDCGHKCQTCKGDDQLHTYRCPTCNGTGTAYRPGVVLDPFLGSGTTAAAALHLGRDATGIDIDHRNINLIRQRIREECEFGKVTIQ